MHSLIFFRRAALFLLLRRTWRLFDRTSSGFLFNLLAAVTLREIDPALRPDDGTYVMRSAPTFHYIMTALVRVLTTGVYNPGAGRLAAFVDCVESSRLMEFSHHLLRRDRS